MIDLKQKRFDDIEIGEEISQMSFHVTQEHINKYAEASGDFNPLHLDEEFAKNTIFKGTIAHGLMTLAFISQVMTKWSWKNWMYGGELEVTFISPVRPGDTVIVGGKIIDKDIEQQKIIVELNVQNSKDDKIVVGKVQFRFDEKGGQ